MAGPLRLEHPLNFGFRHKCKFLIYTLTFNELVDFLKLFAIKHLLGEIRASCRLHCSVSNDLDCHVERSSVHLEFDHVLNHTW